MTFYEPDPSDRLAERSEAAAQDRAYADQRAQNERLAAQQALRQKILHQQAERDAERQRVILTQVA